MSYSNSSVGTLSNLAIRNFTIGQCIEGGQKYLKLNAQGKIIDILATSEGINCAGQDGLVGIQNINGVSILDDCCPSGMKCIQNEGCAYTGIDKCSDYTGEENCNFDDSNVVRRDPSWNSEICGKEENNESGNYKYECKCKWFPAGNSGSCRFIKEAVRRGGGGNPTPGEDSCTEFTCESTSSQGPCSDGQSIITITNIVTGGNCQSGQSNQAEISENCPASEEKIISCGKDPVILPFFGISQMVISLIFIVGIYLILMFRKKIKGER